MKEDYNVTTVITIEGDEITRSVTPRLAPIAQTRLNHFVWLDSTRKKFFRSVSK